jgi:putative methyltransferase (TIGR04325 family)
MNELIRRIVAKIDRTLRPGAQAGFTSPVASWEEAKRLAGSYAHGQILERVAQSTRAVTGGTAVAERDGVVFAKPQIPARLVNKLRELTAARGGLRVLDFGGALGSTYRQCLGELPGGAIAAWVVVEQSHFVDLGRREFRDGTLDFVGSIASAAAGQAIDVAILSGVTQYLEDPLWPLRELRAAGITRVILDRTPTHAGDTDLFTIQRVPKYVYGHPLSYPVRIHSLRRLTADLESMFGPVEVGEGAFDGVMRAGKIPVHFRFFATLTDAGQPTVPRDPS